MIVVILVYCKSLQSLVADCIPWIIYYGSYYILRCCDVCVIIAVIIIIMLTFVGASFKSCAELGLLQSVSGPLKRGWSSEPSLTSG